MKKEKCYQFLKPIKESFESHKENQLKTTEDGILFGALLGLFSIGGNFEVEKSDISELLNMVGPLCQVLDDFVDKINIMFEYFKGYFIKKNNKKKENEFNILQENSKPPRQFGRQSDLILQSSIVEPKIKCNICLEEINIIGETYDLDCGCLAHSKCLYSYIESEIKSGKYEIKCPSCNLLPISDQFIQDALALHGKQDLYTKFKHFQMNHYLSQHANDTAHCPTPNCNYIFCYDNNSSYLKCPLCNKEYCIKCKVKWHEGKTCDAFKREKSEKVLDDKFLKFAQASKFRRCPQCHVFIEKNEGCNHMTCKCGENFCYRCGEKMYNIKGYWMHENKKACPVKD